MKKQLIVLLFAIALAACGTAKNSGRLVNVPVQRQWMLKKMEGATFEELLKAKAFIDLSDLKQTNAKAGCNHILFTTRLKGKNGIAFSGNAATRMYCREYIELEGKLTRLLAQIKLYEINGHFIKFKDAGGTLLAEGVAADWD